MELMGAGWGLLARGGWVMYVIFATSLVGGALILLKWWQFRQAGLDRMGFLPGVMRAARQRQYDVALGQLRGEPNPLARVLEATLRVAGMPQLGAAEREARVSRVATAEIHNLETHLKGLELIGNITPLMGLLGTVTGMIKTFAQVEAAGSNVDPSTLAGGIWEALLTTAFGLVVAIPVLAAFHLLDGKVERLRSRMEDHAAEILEAAEDVATEVAAETAVG